MWFIERTDSSVDSVPIGSVVTQVRAHLKERDVGSGLERTTYTTELSSTEVNKRSLVAEKLSDLVPHFGVVTVHLATVLVAVVDEVQDFSVRNVRTLDVLSEGDGLKVSASRGRESNPLGLSDAVARFEGDKLTVLRETDGQVTTSDEFDGSSHGLVNLVDGLILQDQRGLVNRGSCQFSNWLSTRRSRRCARPDGRERLDDGQP